MKVDYAKLDRAFNPQCIAVVGDRKNPDNIPELDFTWLRAESTFTGKLYSVQTNPKTIEAINALGVKNYTSLLDIPEPVDLVIVAVPRAVAPKILEDCIQKGVAAAHFYTSGFAETDTEEGIRLERLLVERAKRTNFNLIGPNCMGIFNPEVGVPLNSATGGGSATIIVTGTVINGLVGSLELIFISPLKVVSS